MTRLIRALAATGLCLAVAGCSTTTAEMLARPAAANGAASGADFGIVRYLAGGSAADLDARQADADRQMSTACGGHFQVLAKGLRSQLDLQSFGRFGRNVSADTEEYVYIRFACSST